MQNHSEESTLVCFLCHGQDKVVLSELKAEEIRALWASRGLHFSAPALAAIVAEKVIKLYRCQHCGFEFFDGRLAGNETFYRELESKSYYSFLRPEFTRTLEFSRKRGVRRILDVGCGDGAFLSLARDSGFQVAGIELNREAAVKAGEQGHRIFNQMLEQLDLDTVGGPFDVISFFQVLEHVPDPPATMKEATRLLNPGCFISVAVPNAEGSSRLAPLDPHQWPPHHVSRGWLADFKKLAEVTGLRLVDSGGDPLLGSGFLQPWELQSDLCKVLGKAPPPGGRWLPRALSFFYRKFGLKYFSPRWGSSIYGYFQKT